MFKHIMNRRRSLKLLGSLGLSPLFFSCRANGAVQNKASSMAGSRFSNKVGFYIPRLAIPNQKDGVKTFDLKMLSSEKIFLNQPTPTYGINGDYLGPTIMVNKGDNVVLNVHNQLPESTSLHWHGLHVNGSQDGSMHQLIEPSKSWQAKYQVVNQAGTYFYHPHPHGRTGSQVYKGLAGMYIVNDNLSSSLDLPSEYGVDDIPLILQDKAFDSRGQMQYYTDMHTRMLGMLGDYALVNGVISPTLQAKSTLMRFRVLNASNARSWLIRFKDNRPFYMVAGDAGFLPSAFKTTRMFIPPAKRIEILVDVSDKKDDIILYNDDGNFKIPLLKINAEKAKKSPHKIIDFIQERPTIAVNNNTTIRRMHMFMGMGRFSINNKHFSIDRIDEKAKKGDTEIWTITNQSMMGVAHPFHIHGISFLVLDINGKAPPSYLEGYNDVVMIYPSETIRVAMTFNHSADSDNPYMYHCHILEHEDAGMMGQFTVG